MTQKTKYLKAYYEAHKETMKARNRARYEAKKETILAEEKAKRDAERLAKTGSSEPRAPVVGLPRNHPDYMKRYQILHKEKLNKRCAEYYAANKETLLSKQREYAAKPENKARILKRANDWQEANPERVKVRINAWRAANPEVRAVERARRSGLMRNASGNHTKAEALAILKAQNYTCANPYCRADLKTVKRHLDHVQSLARGGSNHASNLQWLCERCNVHKRDTPWDAWLELQHIVFGQTPIGG